MLEESFVLRASKFMNEVQLLDPPHHIFGQIEWKQIPSVVLVYILLRIRYGCSEDKNHPARGRMTMISICCLSKSKIAPSK